MEADEPKYLSLEEQARRYQMAINIEGSNGWADRLRHLLLSGAVTLKQDSGVMEWFEPLLLPNVHYLPIESALRNMSAAVDWVRGHQDEAREMARRAGSLVEQVLSSRALVEYSTAIFRGYATLDAARRKAQPVVEPASHAEFSCDVAARTSELTCRWS